MTFGGKDDGIPVLRNTFPQTAQLVYAMETIEESVGEAGSKSEFVLKMTCNLCQSASTVLPRYFFGVSSHDIMGLF